MENSTITVSFFVIVLSLAHELIKNYVADATLLLEHYYTVSYMEMPETLAPDYV